MNKIKSRVWLTGRESKTAAFLSGTDTGIEWNIQVKTNGDKHYSLVKVGGIVKVTDYSDTFDKAKDAACMLMADTLAELLDVQKEIG